jgi:radical SAM protein with 4Fe4S-binding SPASM domain
MFDELLAPPLPRRLQVEVTAACNLRCRMCLVRYRPTQPRSASMSFAAFKRLIDGLPGLEEVVLQGVGEPLLAPGLFAMLQYARERGIAAGFNCNATLLTRRRAERLLDAGLSWICFSLDGATPQTYEFVRDGARWDTATRNIAGFMRQVRERGGPRPDVSLVMVLMRRNLHEIAGVVTRAAEWGIPRVFAQSLSHDFSDAPGAAYAAIARYVNEQSVAGLPRAEVEAAYAEARAAAERLGVELRLPQLEERPEPIAIAGVPVGCSWPFESGYVAYDGVVQPCCMVMGSDRARLGSVAERPFAEVWESDHFRDFRAGLLNGQPPAVCRGCALYHGRF